MWEWLGRKENQARRSPGKHEWRSLCKTAVATLLDGMARGTLIERVAATLGLWHPTPTPPPPLPLPLSEGEGEETEPLDVLVVSLCTLLASVLALLWWRHQGRR